jgi:hypothetical protein
MKTPAGVVVTPDPARRPVPTPQVRPTRFVVSAVPARQPRGSGQCAITVEERSPGWWAVCRDGRCLNHAGGWEIEPAPTRRTELWLRWHRFADLHTAVQSTVHALPNSPQAGPVSQERFAHAGHGSWS